MISAVVFGQPTITRQPVDQSVSIGATVTNQVSASGSPPLLFQWRFNDAVLAGATNRTLILTNIQIGQAGGYTAIIADSSGSATSRISTLQVDPTFTKITTGPVVTDGGNSWDGAWADYDADGYLDLFVGNGPDEGGVQKTFLYHNNHDGTFSRISTGSVGNESTVSGTGAWGDYDNDGYPDLFVPTKMGLNDLLYRNNGDGSFTKITAGPVVNEGQPDAIGTWADFDNDGNLDLYVTLIFSSSRLNLLYRNNGDGTFTRVTSSVIVKDPGDWVGAEWLTTTMTAASTYSWPSTP